MVAPKYNGIFNNALLGVVKIGTTISFYRVLVVSAIRQVVKRNDNGLGNDVHPVSVDRPSLEKEDGDEDEGEILIQVEIMSSLTYLILLMTATCVE